MKCSTRGTAAGARAARGAGSAAAFTSSSSLTSTLSAISAPPLRTHAKLMTTDTATRGVLAAAVGGAHRTLSFSAAAGSSARASSQVPMIWPVASSSKTSEILASRGARQLSVVLLKAAETMNAADMGGLNEFRFNFCRSCTAVHSSAEPRSTAA